MRFNPKARLDNSRVRDVGRSSGGGGGGRGVSLPSGVAGGGGILGVVVVVVFVAIQLFSGGGSGSDPGSATDRYDSCQDGQDANSSADCARVATENSLRDYWQDQLGDTFRPVESITTFTGSVSTSCGGADSAVGPFYCPSDEKVYLDTGFFEDVLQGRLDGPDGAFVEPYVLAHEYGHHISNLIGTMSQVTGETGPQSTGVRLELQADCFAGMWAKNATSTPDVDGNVLLEDLSDADIAAALSAAKTVGDDYIQKRSGGTVDQEVWTHGSSAQRQKWFRTGYEQGTLEACDTFGADKV